MTSGSGADYYNIDTPHPVINPNFPLSRDKSPTQRRHRVACIFGRSKLGPLLVVSLLSRCFSGKLWTMTSVNYRSMMALPPSPDYPRSLPACCIGRVFVRSRGCGRDFRLQGEYGLVCDPEVLVLKSLDGLLHIAAGPAFVVGMDGHQEGRRLVLHQMSGSHTYPNCLLYTSDAADE